MMEGMDYRSETGARSEVMNAGTWPAPVGEDGGGEFVHFIIYPSSYRNWDQVLRTRILVEIHRDKRTVAFRIVPGFQSPGWALGRGDESPEDRNCARLVHHIVAAQ